MPDTLVNNLRRAANPRTQSVGVFDDIHRTANALEVAIGGDWYPLAILINDAREQQQKLSAAMQAAFGNHDSSEGSE